MSSRLIAFRENLSIRRFLAGTILLLISIHSPAQSPCPGEFHISGHERVSSGSPAESRYHVLLLLQDIALADPRPSGNVLLEYSYEVNMKVLGSSAGLFKLEARFDQVTVPGMNYRGFYLDDALTPEFATLEFDVRNRFGIEVGYLRLDSVPVQQSGWILFTEDLGLEGEEGLCLVNSKAGFVFDEAFYEKFRSVLARVDRYYSAARLADTAIEMSDERHFSRDADLQDMLIRRLEVRRILNTIKDDTALSRFLEDFPDLAGLKGKTQRIEKQFTRLDFKTIALVHHNSGWDLKGTFAGTVMDYTRLLKNYRRLGARNFPFRMDLFNEISSPEFTSGELAGVRELLAASWGSVLPRGFETGIGRLLQQQLLQMSREHRAAGEYQASGEILANARKLSAKWPGIGTGRLREEEKILARETVNAYLGVCRQALQKGSPTLADHYFRKAIESARAFGSDPVIDQLIRNEREKLAAGFIDNAKTLSHKGEHGKSLEILLFVSDYCYRDQGLDCPDQLIPLIMYDYDKIYDEFISRGEHAFVNGMFREAWILLGSAKEYRTLHNDMVFMGMAEVQLERKIAQHFYDQWIYMGENARQYDDPELAIYYFRKAAKLEDGPLYQPEPLLFGWISSAARPLIEEKLAAGRLKAWGLYLLDARRNLEDARQMMVAYGLGDDADLARLAGELEETIRQKECRKKEEEYAAVLESAMKEKALKRFITAQQLVNKAIGLSSDQAGCGFNDMTAYAEKIALEPLADFENREKEIFLLLGKDNQGFIDKYQELGRYFQQNDLGIKGAVYVPLHDWALANGSIDFLQFLTRHYLGLLQPDMALQLLKRLQTLDPDAGNYAYLLRETGRQLAIRDVKLLPHDMMSHYSRYELHGSWYRQLWRNYKQTWIDARGWEVSYLFLFLKR